MAEPSARPLSDTTIVVTRTREQSRALADPLERLGARVIACPAIEVVDPADLRPLDAAIARLETYTWVVLTSTNGVERFLARLEACGTGPQALSDVRVAVVGSATAKCLREAGVTPDFVPADFRAEGLVEGFEALGVGEHDRVLIPRAEEAREILPDALREMGAVVDVVPVYRVVTADLDAVCISAFASGSVDVVTFASGGTASRFVQALDAAGLDAHATLRAVAIASVGPVTTDALAALGLSPAIEAATSTMESLVDAIVAHVAR